MKITKRQLKRIIKEEYSRLKESRHHMDMQRAISQDIDREDEALGRPNEHLSLDWNDFEDMSDPAEAYDWLDRHGITNRREQDEFVEIWKAGDAMPLEYEDLYAAFKGLRR